MCQQSIECLLEGASADGPRSKSLTTRCRPDQRRRPHPSTGCESLVGIPHSSHTAPVRAGVWLAAGPSSAADFVGASEPATPAMFSADSGYRMKGDWQLPGGRGTTLGRFADHLALVGVAVPRASHRRGGLPKQAARSRRRPVPAAPQAHLRVPLLLSPATTQSLVALAEWNLLPAMVDWSPWPMWVPR